MESTLSDVFVTRWNYRVLVRAVHAWWTAVEDSLTTAWLLGFSLRRWRNLLAYMAFNQWFGHVCKERPAGLCTEYSNLDADERRERALEEPSGWHFDWRLRAQATEEEDGIPIVPRRPGSGAVVGRGEGDENSTRQAGVTEADVSSIDEATEKEVDQNDSNTIDRLRIGSSSEHGTETAPAPAPKPEPEPEPEQSWLTSVFGSVPACCVAE